MGARHWAFGTAMLIAVLAPAFGDSDRAAALKDCATLDACLAILDAAPKPRFNDVPGDVAGIAQRLSRFGAPAKVALIARADADKDGWCDFAGAILDSWPVLSPADIPALRDVLNRRPMCWIALPLGRIGTAEAIKVLVDTVEGSSGPGSPASVALQRLGVRAVPALMAALEGNAGGYGASVVLGQLDGRDIDALAPQWARTAADPTMPQGQRIAALRALAIFGHRVAAQGPLLRPLAMQSEQRLRDTAIDTLQAMDDEAALPALMKTCHRTRDYRDGTDDYVSFVTNNECIERVASFGAAARPFAPDIARIYLASKNGNDRALGVAALGYIGAFEMRSHLVALLSDPDWRVVYAAARSLGWLKARDAGPVLARIAKSYWLTPVRDEARAVLGSFKPGAPPLEMPTPSASFLRNARVALQVDARAAPDIAPCASGHWRYRGITFAEPTQRQLKIEGGALGHQGRVIVGDEGEWGGGLWWDGPSHPPGLPLIAMNGIAVEPSSQGAVAALGEQGNYVAYDPNNPRGAQYGGNGPSGFGLVVALTIKDGVLMTLREIARLPRAPDVIATIAPDLYAAWSGGRVVVFDLKGIDGVAACVAG